MQVHTEKIKAVLDSQGWYYKGGGANFGYLYRNDAPSVIFQGVGKTFTAQGNTQVTISGINCRFYFKDTVNALIEDDSVSLLSYSGNNTIKNEGDNASIFGQSMRSAEDSDVVVFSSSNVAYNEGANSKISICGVNNTVANEGDNAVIRIDAPNYTNGAGERVTVDAGVSSDYITVTGDSKDCSIFGGADGDSIFNNSNGNVFQYNGNFAGGTDSLTAFNSNDLFYIADSTCTVTDSLSAATPVCKLPKTLLTPSFCLSARLPAILYG